MGSFYTNVIVSFPFIVIKGFVQRGALWIWTWVMQNCMYCPEMQCITSFSNSDNEKITTIHLEIFLSIYNSICAIYNLKVFLVKNANRHWVFLGFNMLNLLYYTNYNTDDHFILPRMFSRWALYILSFSPCLFLNTSIFSLLMTQFSRMEH